MKNRNTTTFISTKVISAKAAKISATLLLTLGSVSAMAILPTPEEGSAATTGATANPAAVTTAAPARRAAAGSSAQGVSSQITASLVSTNASGQEVLAPVTEQTQLQSGNIIEYHGYFTNTNPERVRKMTVTMTIPNEVELMGSVTPEFPFGSIDGSNFSRMPLRGTIDGQNQEIPLSYYKAVRWDVEGIGLNDTVKVSYRAKVK